MAQVQIRINGRSYEIACGDGEEEHVTRLSRYVDKKVGELAAQVGQVGDTRLLVMAALVLTDELSDAYGEIKKARNGSGEPTRAESEVADGLAALARRIDDIAASLERA